MDYESATNFVKGKQVIVVGFHKSALDIAMECSEANGNIVHFKMSIFMIMICLFAPLIFNFIELLQG